MNQGTISRGIRLPIVKKGDDIISIITDSLLKVVKEDNVKLDDKDVVCVTEALLGRSQGNYASTEDIALDIKKKYGSATIGVVFPILSRNRFSNILKGISKGSNKIIIQLSYPDDEVGNKLIQLKDIYQKGIKLNETFTLKQFKEIFENTTHEFTGVDYLEFYKSISPNCIDIILSNDPLAILNYTKDILVSSIHNRHHLKELYKENHANKVYGIDDILAEKSLNHGYHDRYGLLGSNLVDDHTLKLFPRDADKFVLELQKRLIETFHVNLEVMVYGDGAFKDPQGGIWELADPVVSPGFTNGLIGTPNEIKLKYVADNELKDFTGEDLTKKMKDKIKEKDNNLFNKFISQGTTPRQYTDLLGSLADLTSGSGDKGTPVVLIQNYFKNYSND